MPKQLWYHKTKRNFVIRHSNADVILPDGTYFEFIPVGSFVTIEHVGFDGIEVIHKDAFFEQYARVAIDNKDTVDSFKEKLNDTTIG